MGQVGYLILAIVIIIALIAFFTTFFILYKKTPVPPGCEKVASEQCAGCNARGCEFYGSYLEETSSPKATEENKIEENKDDSK